LHCQRNFSTFITSSLRNDPIRVIIRINFATKPKKNKGVSKFQPYNPGVLNQDCKDTFAGDAQIKYISIDTCHLGQNSAL